MKSENEIISSPFEITTVKCSSDCIVSGLQTKIAELNDEKSKLIDELIEIKAKNQTLFFENQSKQQTIVSLQDAQIELQEKLNSQSVINNNLTREKNALERKIKQLMATTSANVLKSEKDQKIDPTSDQSDDDSEYEVESILNHEIKRGKQRRFLIRWKGYPPSHDCWVSESNLQCDQILKAYLNTNGLTTLKKSKHK